jgi:ABC-type antimicrobial peptide transport system permease subunit
MRAVFRTVRILGWALITLGILGGAAVLAAVEIGQGSQKAISEAIKSVGGNSLLVLPGTASTDGVGTLTDADALAIAEECKPAVVGVAPVVRARTQVVYGNRNWVPVCIYGTTAAFLDVRGWNLMLVSVTERTRAIGQRLGAGARPRDILRRFLTEAILLGFASGIISILLGRLGSYLVWRYWRWPIEPSLLVVAAALVASISVGLIFGCYPAWKASRLDPIEALPHE